NKMAPSRSAAQRIRGTTRRFIQLKTGRAKSGSRGSSVGAARVRSARLAPGKADKPGKLVVSDTAPLGAQASAGSWLASNYVESNGKDSSRSDSTDKPAGF